MRVNFQESVLTLIKPSGLYHVYVNARFAIFAFRTEI